VKGSILVSASVERRHGEALERAAPGVHRLVLDLDGGSAGLADVEAAYFSGDLFPDSVRSLAHALRAVRDLCWLHTFSAGIDDRFFQRMLERGTRITTSSGAQAVPIAQTVMLYLLALSRDLPGWLDDQAQRRWNPREVVDLQGRSLLVIGLGSIGLEVARLGQEFGMKVIGVRRSPAGDEPFEIRTLRDLEELLPRADAVVLALPLNPDTRGILGGAQLRLMKADAIVVNIGRGELIDEPALVQALDEGRIGGAGLDVFQVEPLPAESPLWSMPNVIVTPHSSGSTPGNLGRADAIFVDNVGRYMRCEPLRNEV
jgi:phosphoglycerate dehydrogenase-like enzyme